MIGVREKRLEVLAIMLETAHRDCFGCGDPGDDRVHLGLRWDEEKQMVRGDITFGRRAQGPPGHVHGGCLATVLDEAMGASAWLSGHPCLAASLNVNYRHMVPINSTMRLEARVIEVIDRKVTITAELRDSGGEILADGRGLFIKIERERFAHLVNEGTDPFHRWLQKGLI